MTEIARGEITINLNDAPAKAQLQSLERSVKDAFRDMARERATPEVRLDYGDFERGYQTVKKQIDSLKRERAQAAVRLDVDGVTKAQADILLLERELKALDRKRYEAVFRLRVEDDARNAVEKIERTIGSLRKHEKVMVGVDLDRSDLQRVEAELEARIAALNRRKAKLVIEGDTTGILAAAAELKVLDAQLDHTRNKISAFNREPLVIHPSLDNRQLRGIGREIEAEMKAIEKNRGKLILSGDTRGLRDADNDLKRLRTDLLNVTARRWDLNLPFLGKKRDIDEFGNKIGFVQRNMDRFGEVVQSFKGWWNEFGGSVLGAGIRLGPLTLKLRTLLGILPLLSTGLTSMIGSFGALASVLYGGVLGALGPAIAGIGSLSVGIGGVVAVAYPLVKSLTNVEKAQQAYNKAVLAGGKDSTTAKNNLEKLQHTMGGVGKETALAFSQLNKIPSMWRRLTAGAKPAFFDTIAQGIRTVRKDMPLFARESVKAFDVAAGGVQKWLKGLRSDEARNIFRSLFRGFDAQLPNIQNAIGNIATTIGRIASAGQPLFTAFTATLDRWTKGWANAVKDPQKVQGVMQDLAKDTVSLGKAVGAAARVLHNLFMGGRNEGRGFLDTITQTLNRWADFLATAKGQNAVAEFFRESIQFANTFFGTLGNLVKIFFQFAEAIRPAAQLLGDFIRLLTSIKGFSGFLVAVFGSAVALSGLARILVALNSIKAAMAAIKAGQGIFGALAAGQLAKRGILTGAATAGAEGIAGGVAARGAVTGTRAERVAASKAASEFEQLGGAAGAARLSTVGLTAAIAGLANPLTVATAGVGSLIAVNKILNDNAKRNNADLIENVRRVQNLNEVRENEKKLVVANAQGNNALRQSSVDLTRAQLNQKSAQQTVTQLQKQGKRGTFEYQMALLDLKQANIDVGNANKSYGDTARAALEPAHALTQSRRADVLALKDWIKHEKAGGTTAAQLAPKLKELHDAELAYQTAINREIATNVNVARARKNLQIITGEAALKMGLLIKTAGQFGKQDVVRKFFIQANTKQAESAIRNVSQLQKAGVNDKQIIDIFANADDAKDAIHDLKALLRNLPDANVNVNAKDHATPIVQHAKAAIKSFERSYFGVLRARNQTGNPIQAAVGAAVHFARTYTATLRARNLAGNPIQAAISAATGFARTYTATLNTRHTSSGGRGHATGGIGATEAPRRTFGEIGNRPRFLYGEENRQEIVIATNPNYRRRNLKLLRHAARMLGVQQLDARSEVGDVLADSDTGMFAQGGTHGHPSATDRKKQNAAAKKRKEARQHKRFKRARRRLSHFTKITSPDMASDKSRIKSLETTLANKIQERDQDDTQYGIDLDNNPIIKTDAAGEDYVDESARQERIGKLQSLQNKTMDILAKYKKLLDALGRARKRANDLIAAYERKMKTYTFKKFGKDAKKLRDQAGGKIHDLAEDRSNIVDRINEIGDENTRGERRDERLNYNRYDSEIKQVRETTTRSQQDSQQDTAGAEQAKAQASFFKTLAESATGTLATFRSSGDIGEGFTSAFSAAVQGAVGSFAGAQSAGGVQTALGALSAGLTGGPAAPTQQSQAAGSPDGAGGGGTQIIIQTLHPADPATLDAIGQAATGGISLQGAVISPREPVTI